MPLFDPKRLLPGQATSIFEKKALEYGYQFFENKPINYWERREMSSEKAIKICDNFIRRHMKPHNINAGEPWLSMHYLSVLNLTPREARKIGWEKIYLNKTDIIRANNTQYFDMLKSSIVGIK